MSRRERPLSDDERVLWNTVARSVAPLKGRTHQVIEPPAPPPRPLARNDKPARSVLSAPPAPPQRVAPPPLASIDRRMKQKLVRGTADIGGRIDLHGMTQAEAHRALGRFLHQAQARDAKVVLVITGKGGLSGEGRGVLRRQVPMWLEGAEFRSLVIGFDGAGASHGGEGALYVRVRRAR